MLLLFYVFFGCSLFVFIKFVLIYNVARFNRRILARFGESLGANIVQKHWLRSKYLSILNVMVFRTLTLFQFMNDYSFTSRNAVLNQYKVKVGIEKKNFLPPSSYI